MIAHQAPLFMGFPRQEYCSELPFPPSGDLPNPGTESTSPVLIADSLPLHHQGSILYISSLKFSRSVMSDSLRPHELQHTRPPCPGEGNGTPLQYSCLANPMDGGAWWAAVHVVARSRTRLSDFTFTFHFHALEKEMATHSSVLAWRIPGMGEPGGLPSLGSHRVGHD